MLGTHVADQAYDVIGGPAALALSLIVALLGGLLLGKIHRSPAPLEVALDTALAYVAIFAT